MKLIFWSVISIGILWGATMCFGQTNLISTNAISSSNVTTAAQDFSNGLSALGITLSVGAITQIIILLHILAKALLKYAVKNPNAPTTVVSKLIKFAAVDRVTTPTVPAAVVPAATAPVKAAIVLLLLSLGLGANAQTNVTSINPTNVVAVTPPATNQVPNLLTNNDTLTEIYIALETSGIFDSTNYSVDPYITYAPHAPQGDKIGGGILAIYNVNNYVGLALGADYLGQFSLVSGNATIKMPINVGNYLGASWATNFTVSPFVLAGVGKPTGGSSSDVAIIADIGVATEFGHLWGGRFNAGVSYGTWIDAGVYSGIRYHVFAGWSHGF